MRSLKVLLLITSSDARVNQHGPRRSGILETVQAIPTSTTPTVRISARGNSTANYMKNSTRAFDAVNNTLAKTNLSSPVNDKTAANSVSVVQNATNGLKNLATYSLDQPNSFPQPTSIPPIDTMSAAWPTPMGPIDNEMDDVGSPPSLQPIANEMSSEEKIPNIADISDVERIPLDFQEEEPWERSHATAANVSASHDTQGHFSSSLGHAASRHFIPTLSRSRKKSALKEASKMTSAYARRRDTDTPRSLLRSWNTKLKVSQLRRKRKLKSNSRILPNYKARCLKGTKTLRPCSFTKTKKSRKRVSIPPPAPIDPIQPLLETFQKEKEVGDIKEHTVDIETVKPHEGIDKHLITLETQPNIKPIAEHLSKEQLPDIEPIANHQLVEKTK